MEQFLQAYGGWILIGLFFLLMLRLHGSGSGCCMGHRDHAQPRDASQRPSPTADDPSDQSKFPKGQPPTTSGAHGCH